MNGTTLSEVSILQMDELKSSEESKPKESKPDGNGNPPRNSLHQRPDLVSN